jgi:DNA-binding beta-propeller fold protein YncE
MALPSGTPAQIGVTAAAGARIRFSPSGTAALLYAPGSLTATILTSLASSTQIRQLSVSAPLLDLAVSDAGTAVALLQSSSGATVSLLGSGGAQPLLTIGAPGGLSFAGTSENLVVADAAANALTLIRSASSAPAPLQLATAGLLKAPLAVGTSLNGQWVAVANSAESSVVRIDLTGVTAPLRVASPAQPTLVGQLSGNGVFRFNNLSPDPVWIADVTAASPSMLFIPPAAQ